MAWANRMPAEFPVYPKAKLMEAAGADGGGCDLRVVSFVTNQPMQNVIDYYYTKAIRSGFDAEHQLMNGEHVLGGVRKKGDGAYRSEEHTSELQSLMRISYAVFCLQKKTPNETHTES